MSQEGGKYRQALIEALSTCKAIFRPTTGLERETKKRKEARLKKKKREKESMNA